MLEAMLWILRTGAPWRDLPPEYGSWQTVYTRFSRWSQKDVLKRVFDKLAEARDGEAYSAKALVGALVARGCTVVIPANPTHPQRDYDTHLYKDRHLMENFFQRIKRFRRIAMRFEKLARNFLAFLFLASSLVWLL